MNNEQLIMDISDQSLFKKLKSDKAELIAKKKIMDKKDKHIYPISKIPFLIPKNWVWTYLSDISIIQEGPGIRKHQYQNDGVQFLTVTNILEGSVDLEKSKKYISIDEYNEKYSHFTLNKGDIVTACSGGSWGKSAIYDYDNKIILNTSTLRLRFFNDLGSNKYLYYITKTDYFKKSLSSYSTGQQPNYGYYHYSRIPIPLPPLSEQKRIVNILDKAFAEIAQAKANAEQNLKNAKELFESYLNGIFEKKGDDSASANASADKWEEKTFEELSSKIGDGLHGTPKYDESGEYFFINGNNLNDGKIEIKEDTKRINKEEFEKYKKTLTNNTVLISINGTLGKVAFYNNEPVILGKSACYINFNDEVNKHYIKYLVKSPLFFKNMGNLSTGATIKNFSLKSMRNYTLPLPSITEQKQIVKKLDQLQAETKKLELVYQQKLDNLEELKKSILQKAFNGEL